MRGEQVAPATWLSTAQVAEHLGISHDVLADLMRQPVKEQPWVTYGGVERTRSARYRWNADQVDEWYRRAMLARGTPILLSTTAHGLLYNSNLSGPEPGHVYFIETRSIAKVGWARDVIARGRTYRSHGADIVVRAVTRHGGWKLELEAHRALSNAQIAGEWFQQAAVNELLREWTDKCPAAFSRELVEAMSLASEAIR